MTIRTSYDLHRKASMNERLSDIAKAIALKHPLTTVAIAMASLILASLLLFLWFFRNPDNLEDCIWTASKAPTSMGAEAATRFCYKKFRVEANALHQ
jgi:hypothetical protein